MKYFHLKTKYHEWDFYEMMTKKGYKQLDCIDCTNTPCAPAIPSPDQVMAIMGNVLFETGAKPQKKETAMDTRTEAQQAKDYLIESLNQAMRIKERELHKEFNLDGRGGIRTFGDLRKALKEGWVSIHEGYEHVKDEETLFDSPVYMLNVSDPEKKPDHEGYAEAVKKMKKEASNVKDQIVVMGPEKGLEALNAFKAETFH